MPVAMLCNLRQRLDSRQSDLLVPMLQANKHGINGATIAFGGHTAEGPRRRRTHRAQRVLEPAAQGCNGSLISLLGHLGYGPDRSLPCCRLTVLQHGARRAHSMLAASSSCLRQRRKRRLPYLGAWVPQTHDHLVDGLGVSALRNLRETPHCGPPHLDPLVLQSQAHCTDGSWVPLVRHMHKRVHPRPPPFHVRALQAGANSNDVVPAALPRHPRQRLKGCTPDPGLLVPEAQNRRLHSVFIAPCRHSAQRFRRRLPHTRLPMFQALRCLVQGTRGLVQHDKGGRRPQEQPRKSNALLLAGRERPRPIRAFAVQLRHEPVEAHCLERLRELRVSGRRVTRAQVRELRPQRGPPRQHVGLLRQALHAAPGGGRARAWRHRQLSAPHVPLRQARDGTAQ
mmetsp:Transcript_20403/g.63149  ORF Transcript_20403/g.63149 Transcript_20403/m.63149 type:complete len:397 (+) Transcript_20403:1104-2294(+)